MKLDVLRSILAIVALCAVVGCGSSNTDNNNDNKDPDGGTTADKGTEADKSTTPGVDPSADFKDIEPYDGVEGEADIEVEVSESVDKVELLADGKVVATADATPFTIKWKSTEVGDGIVKLTLKSYAGEKTATSEELPVVLHNNGEEANWINGNGGVMTIVPGMDNHHKYHWVMPAGIKRVISILFWDNPKFEMDLAIGVGTCPHSGTEATRVAGKTTPIVVDYSAEGVMAEAQWFAHGGGTNEADVADEETTVLFKTYLLKD